MCSANKLNISKTALFKSKTRLWKGNNNVCLPTEILIIKSITCQNQFLSIDINQRHCSCLPFVYVLSFTVFCFFDIFVAFYYCIGKRLCYLYKY